jgi:hypothetical protein
LAREHADRLIAVEVAPARASGSPAVRNALAHDQKRVSEPCENIVIGLFTAAGADGRSSSRIRDRVAKAHVSDRRCQLRYRCVRRPPR